MSTFGSFSFWVDTIERAIRAYCQGVTTAFGLGLPFIGLSVPWRIALIAGAVYSGLSVLTCIASLAFPKADKETGSFLAMPPYQLGAVRSWFRRRI